MKKGYFETRDYVFAAMIAGIYLVLSSLLVPVTLPLRIPGLTNAVNAPVFSFLLVVGLTRIRKPGAHLLIAGIYGTICLLISPVIFGFVLISAVVAELVSSLIFRGYRSKWARLTVCIIHHQVSMYAALGITFFFTPERYQAHLWWVWAIASLAVLFTSFIGWLVGEKATKELIRAGKIPVEREDLSA